MAIAPDPTDSANLPPQARIAEIAAILAQGVVRLRRRAAIPDADALTIHSIESPESRANGLDVVPERSVHGPRG